MFISPSDHNRKICLNRAGDTFFITCSVRVRSLALFIGNSWEGRDCTRELRRRGGAGARCSNLRRGGSIYLLEINATLIDFEYLMETRIEIKRERAHALRPTFSCPLSARNVSAEHSSCRRSSGHSVAAAVRRLVYSDPFSWGTSDETYRAVYMPVFASL